MKAASALLRGGRDVLRPAILGLVAASVGLSLLILGLLQAAIIRGLRAVLPGQLHLPWIGDIALPDSLSWGGLLLLPVLGIFLMAPVAAAVCGLFAETVAERVERRHYPARQGKSIGFLDGLGETLAVFAAVLAVTLLGLIATPLLGPLAPLLMLGANGFLLGREFFQMVARRHLDRPRATALRRRHGGTVTALGGLIALALSVPGLNIVVPVLAAAAFTHLFHMLSGSADPSFRPARG